VIVTPTATAARTDCPSAQAVFLDVSGRLSLCAPAQVVALSDVNLNGEPGITISSSAGGTVASGLPQFAVAARISKSAAVLQPLIDTCAKAFDGGQAVSLQVGPLTESGCQAQTEMNSTSGPLMELHLSAQLSPGSDGSPRYLNVTVTWRTRSSGADALARQIAQSLQAA
jgi:hypothetical protein